MGSKEVSILMLLSLVTSLTLVYCSLALVGSSACKLSTNNSLLPKIIVTSKTIYNENTEDTYCSNSASSICDTIIVHAWIYGTEPYSSTGGGSAEGYEVLGGICCVHYDAASIQIGYYDPFTGTFYGVRRLLWFDGSISQSFTGPVGRVVISSTLQNFCDSVEPSVAATLSGTCLT